MIRRRARGDLAFDLDGPGTDLHVVRVACRVILLRTKFIKIVVADDMLERVRGLTRAVRARFDVAERRLRRHGRSSPLQKHRGHGRAGGGSHEIAAVHKQTFVGDLGGPNVCRVPDQHCALFGLKGSNLVAPARAPGRGGRSPHCNSGRSAALARTGNFACRSDPRRHGAPAEEGSRN
jgi:hypothetical protein